MKNDGRVVTSFVLGECPCRYMWFLVEGVASNNLVIQEIIVDVMRHTDHHTKTVRGESTVEKIISVIRLRRQTKALSSRDFREQLRLRSY